MKYVHIVLILVQATLGAAAADGVLANVITDAQTLGKVVAGIAALQLVVKTVDGYIAILAAKKA